MKRFVCLVLCLLMLLGLCGCKGGGKLKNKGGTEVSSKPINLAYSREEGLNPFKCSSLINYCIMPLLYDSLYTIDSTYYPTGSLATAINFNNLIAEVTIDTSRKFSNGQAITPDDVVYSFRTAKNSTYYGSALRNVSTCEVVDEQTVRFVTAPANAYLASDLTFPIIQADCTDDIPASSGPYIYKATTEGGTLTQNKYYPSTEYASSTINLNNTTDTSSLNMGIVIGDMDAYFDDMSEGSSDRISVGAAQVDLNNLVYFRFNDGNYFSNPKLRQAFAMVIDRSQLLESGYEGYGEATSMPFNPQWYAAKDCTWENPMTVDEAKEYITSYLGKYTVTILVNSGNEFRQKCAERIGDQLASFGVNSKIEVAPWDVFEEGLENGRYDIFLGEFKMSNDMNTGPLYFTEYLQTRMLNMIAGAITPSEFMADFIAEQPFVPICIRYGVTAYSKSLQGGIAPLPNNPFANLTEWYK